MLILNYPVVKIHTSYVIGNIRKEHSLSVGSEKKFNDRKAEDYIILDSLGLKYGVNSLTLLTPSQLPFSKRVFYISNLIAKEKLIWVDYNLTEPEQLNLAEMKELIFHKICLLKPKWKKNGPSANALKDHLFAAQTIKELTSRVYIYP